DGLEVDAVAGAALERHAAADAIGIDIARLEVLNQDIAAQGGEHQRAIRLDAVDPHVTGHGLQRGHPAEAGAGHVAADRLAAHLALHAIPLQAAGHRLHFPPRRRRYADREVHPAAIVAPGVIRSYLDAPADLVHRHLDVLHLPAGVIVGVSLSVLQ